MAARDIFLHLGAVNLKLVVANFLTWFTAFLNRNRGKCFTGSFFHIPSVGTCIVCSVM